MYVPTIIHSVQHISFIMRNNHVEAKNVSVKFHFSLPLLRYSSQNQSDQHNVNVIHKATQVSGLHKQTTTDKY